MEMSHYTHIGNFEVFEASYIQSVNRKPEGLWLSDGIAWPEWCVESDFRHPKFKYDIIIDPSQTIILRDREMLKEFSHKHNVPIGHSRSLIDWGNVSKMFSGVIISPFDYNFGFEPEGSWSYGWDCSSGCIWDLSCIRSVERDFKWSYDEFKRTIAA